MTSAKTNPFSTVRRVLEVSGGKITIYSLDTFAKGAGISIDRLPFSLKVLLEAALRQCDEFEITQDDVFNVARWDAKNVRPVEHPFKPARVVLQDYSGVPCLVDLAAMRSAVARLNGDPRRINPVVPVDMVIDHSVQVDYFGSPDALRLNISKEFERNLERYQFARWGQNAFQNFRVVPPGSGIVHQVNLEYLASVVMTKDGLAYPDTVVGTDSHTTMINGLGVVGWGVGGIEAEAVMLGQPLYIVMPEVIGFKLYGALREGVTATDLTLTVVQMLRKKGVVEKFVEFYGAGLSSMSLPDRATIANMAPEYGATMGYFPIDDETLRYLRQSGRPAELVDRVERYAKEQGLFRTDATPDPVFTDTLELDLSTVEPSVAGPKRPQDRVPLSQMKSAFRKALTAPVKERGFGLREEELTRAATVRFSNGHVEEVALKHGAVVIAAITSCTNTSNPSVMVGAGLLAKKAVAKGLRVPKYVKTSLAPGSRVVTAYLREAGLLDALETLGFHVVGYGCTTCIGNSGPLPQLVADAVHSHNLVACAVLSGNRNFEGRINPYVKANYLASPPLVVAYALAGTTDIDLLNEPLGVGRDGEPVYLRDIWPTQQEIQQTIAQAVQPEMYQAEYATITLGSELWQAITGVGGDLYAWDEHSTYIQEPPYFEQFTVQPAPVQPIVNARVLGLFGDSITTDHISPAGDIAADSPAGRYLLERGVPKEEFNQYGTRRGNDRVMTRGTFANIRLKNLLVPGVEGGVTRYLGPVDFGVVDLAAAPVMPIYDAAMQYKAAGVPLVVIAGKEYGTGSSRDWAAKGSALLGVRAVIAESYERIHRNNLVGMGVLPLQFVDGQNAETLGLTGAEVFTIDVSSDIQPRQRLIVRVRRLDGSEFTFEAQARLDTPVEVNYYRNGGILPTVLRQMLA
ncbi:MAG: aconitate hydratase AcnA [Anaerolineae bacterium]|nr:aconitate hydratase AcnA [Thermoflexales bacterium]MDW8408105.1 aconitate hydratase AcnA [Anaerolineae bacterium]